ncbi:helix-turn-helix transcriptional regulator [Nitrosomonas sp.]|uniref:helix-turn-helix transcriptional regulator n=1 Tax=Nitrosomonas sp. TaxID=42353 RepID=UPI0025F0DCFC|nr:helix-turn-helix transcriptional regulator [Nitrosomonas sp.]
MQYARISLKSLIPKPYDFEPRTLGEHVLKRRLYLKLSQPKLAKLLGVAAETILNWELNYKKPSINHIGKLIQFLGYDPALPNPSSIAELLLAKRRELGWSQKIAAQNLGVDPCTWSSWECGGTIMMQKHRQLVASFLGIDEEKVCGDMSRQWNESYWK